MLRGSAEQGSGMVCCGAGAAARRRILLWVDGAVAQRIARRQLQIVAEELADQWAGEAAAGPGGGAVPARLLQVGGPGGDTGRVDVAVPAVAVSRRGPGMPTVLKSLRSARSPLVGWPKKPLPTKTLPETFEPKSVKKQVGPPPIESA